MNTWPIFNLLGRKTGHEPVKTDEDPRLVQTGSRLEKSGLEQSGPVF
jgi:hypothetical protein